MRSLRFTGEELQMLLEGRVEQFWPASLIAVPAEESASKRSNSLQSGEYRLLVSAPEVNGIQFEWCVSSGTPLGKRLIVELIASEDAAKDDDGLYVLTTAEALSMIQKFRPSLNSLKVVYFQDRFLSGTVSGLR